MHHSFIQLNLSTRQPPNWSFFYPQNSLEKGLTLEKRDDFQKMAKMAIFVNIAKITVTQNDRRKRKQGHFSKSCNGVKVANMAIFPVAKVLN